MKHTISKTHYSRRRVTLQRHRRRRRVNISSSFPIRARSVRDSCPTARRPRFSARQRSHYNYNYYRYYYRRDDYGQRAVIAVINKKKTQHVSAAIRLIDCVIVIARCAHCGCVTYGGRLVWSKARRATQRNAYRPRTGVRVDVRHRVQYYEVYLGVSHERFHDETFD